MPERPLHFRIEWQQPGDGITAAELAATWARLEIDVQGDSVTTVRDSSTGSLRESLVVPTYPLAEWIVFHWWQLRFWGSPGGSAPPQVFEREHSLRNIGDGFIWPDLSIVPEGDVTTLRWRPPPTDGGQIRFLTAGRATIGAAGFTSAVADLVEATLARLDEAGVVGTALHKEWEVLKNLDADEVAFCEACGRLGIDPFAEGAELAEQLSAISDALGAACDDFLDASAPDNLSSGLDWIERADDALAALPQPSRVDWPVADQRQYAWVAAGPGPSAVPAYVEGYRQATALRAVLGLEATAPLLLEQLPVGLALPIPSPNHALHGRCAVGDRPGYAQLVLGWDAKPPSALFAAARAVWAVTFSDGERSLLTGTASRRQRISRAFAAELLAPAEGIRAVLGGRLDPETSESVADHFGVSEKVIEHQIANRLG